VNHSFFHNINAEHSTRLFRIQERGELELEVTEDALPLLHWSQGFRAAALIGHRSPAPTIRR